MAMDGRWSRYVDPVYPYRAERAKGSGDWRAAAVACYSAAWQLIVPSLMVTLVISGWADDRPAAWWLFSPSVASALAGAWCALSDRLEDDAFRWWGPWNLLAPAGTGLAYAFGPRRADTVTRDS